MNGKTIQNILHVNNRTFRVVVTRYSEDEYLAEIPSLTHCISSGGSIEEVITSITEVLEATLEVMQQEGLPIPDDSQNTESTIQQNLSTDLPTHNESISQKPHQNNGKKRMGSQKDSRKPSYICTS